MQKIKMKFLFIAIHIFSFIQVSAQTQSANSSSLLPRSKTIQILSPTAQIFTNVLLRDQLIPKFDGKYHAQGIVNETFILDNSDFILSSLIDPENPNYRIAHLSFIAENWNQIIDHPGLIYLDVSSKLNSPKPLNDTARIHSRVDKAENGIANGLSQNYTGKDVIVGIVDIGFQTDHPTFYSPDGKNSKIQRFWNQQKSGNPPTLYSYGTEYSDSMSIASAIDDDGSHGTHVAGIAAGSGLGSPNLKYRGMAPQSDIVMVGIKYANDTLGGSGLGDYIVANPTIIDGYNYVFKYAELQNKPSVCNLSWGMHTGPHDGTSLFDRSVKAITGSGRIVVGAAGNDGRNKMHINETLNGDTSFTLVVDNNRKDYPHENIYMDIWGGIKNGSGDKLKIQLNLVDTFGNVLINTPWNLAGDCVNCGAYKTLYIKGNDTLSVIITEQNYPFNGKSNFLVIAEHNRPYNGYIRLGITSSGEVNAWNSGQAYRWTSGHFWKGHKSQSFGKKYIEGIPEGSVGENGGSGIHTLTAGAYINRNEWTNYKGEYFYQPWNIVGDIAGFSSRGPMPKSVSHPSGRIKPDIIAPGQSITSALHRRQVPGWLNNELMHKTQYNGNDVYWAMFSGTSMAAPHTTGIVALYLQANEWLTPLEIRSLWRLTARKDQYTTNDSNGNSGYGKVDAFETLKIIDQYANIPKHQLNQGWVYFVNGDQQLVVSNIKNPSNYNALIYNCSGQLIKNCKSTIDSCFIDISNLSSGVYFIKIEDLLGNKQFSGKFIK